MRRVVESIAWIVALTVTLSPGFVTVFVWAEAIAAHASTPAAHRNDFLVMGFSLLRQLLDEIANTIANHLVPFAVVLDLVDVAFGDSAPDDV